jgi:hypothetical protein
MQTIKYLNIMNDVNKTSKKTGLSVDLLNFLMVTTENENGNAFAYVNSYTAKGSGEVANHKVNLNFRYANAMDKDLKGLKDLNIHTYFNTFTISIKSFIQSKINYLIENGAKDSTVNHFKAILSSDKFTKDLMYSAYENVFNTVVRIGEKNYDRSIKVASVYSKAQTETYEAINNTVKYHKENETIYIYAKTEKKTVITKGKLKETKYGAMVIAQDFFKLGFKSTKYRNYIIGRADLISAYKRKFDGSELAIDI